MRNRTVLLCAAGLCVLSAGPASADFTGQTILGPLTNGSMVSGTTSGKSDDNDGFDSGGHFFFIWDGGDDVYQADSGAQGAGCFGYGQLTDAGGNEGCAERAIEALRAGKCDVALVGGVESYIDAHTLEWLDDNGQLLDDHDSRPYQLRFRRNGWFDDTGQLIAVVAKFDHPDNGHTLPISRADVDFNDVVGLQVADRVADDFQQLFRAEQTFGLAECGDLGGRRRSGAARCGQTIHPVAVAKWAGPKGPDPAPV